MFVAGGQRINLSVEKLWKRWKFASVIAQFVNLVTPECSTVTCEKLVTPFENLIRPKSKENPKENLVILLKLQNNDVIKKLFPRMRTTKLNGNVIFRYFWSTTFILPVLLLFLFFFLLYGFFGNDSLGSGNAPKFTYRQPYFKTSWRSDFDEKWDTLDTVGGPKNQSVGQKTIKTMEIRLYYRTIRKLRYSGVFNATSEKLVILFENLVCPKSKENP